MFLFINFNWYLYLTNLYSCSRHIHHTLNVNINKITWHLTGLDIDVLTPIWDLNVTRSRGMSWMSEILILSNRLKEVTNSYVLHCFWTSKNVHISTNRCPIEMGFESRCSILNGQVIKGIVSDSNSIFLWHESEHINKKCLFPKFQLIPISCFQVMHDYVFHCSHRLLCWKVLCTRLSVKNCYHFILKWFEPNSFGEFCFLEESYRNMQKNSNFENFGSALYSTSVSMPLIVNWNWMLPTCDSFPLIVSQMLALGRLLILYS